MSSEAQPDGVSSTRPDPAAPATTPTTPTTRAEARPGAGAHEAFAAAPGEAFRLMVESVRDYAIFMLDTGGHIATWNAGAQRIKGYAAEEIIGQHFSRFYLPEEAEARIPQQELEVAQAEGRWEGEGERVRKDGTRFWANVVITSLWGPDGKLRGYAKVTRDVTDRRHAEQELRAAKERAEEASRAKDHFLAVLSHELRTPLTPILATVSFVEKRSDLPEELRVEIGALRRNVELETRLVDDLLDMTRIARGKVALHPEIVDVHALVRGALQNVQKEIDDKELDVTISLHARARLVWADPVRIQQVLTNLVQNAAKFTPRGGAITIRSRDDEGRVQVEVTDTGIGIGPACCRTSSSRSSRASGRSRGSTAGWGWGWPSPSRWSKCTTAR